MGQGVWPIIQSVSLDLLTIIIQKVGRMKRNVLFQNDTGLAIFEFFFSCVASEKKNS